MAPEPVSPVLDLLGLSGEVLPGLRDRLFDLTRRNRMLYFRSTRGALDLSAATHGSKNPLIEDAATARRLVSGTGIRLDDRLEPEAVDQLRTLAAQARRDRAEYGVSSLHLITSFLLRPDPIEPGKTVRSPLLLIPVELVRDGSSFHLKAASDEAVVNPVLRFELERRYGVDLPETWPLDRLRQGSMRGRLSGQGASTRGFWVDSSSVTLTTIAYRSSGLVRDYRALIDQTFDTSPNFEPDETASRHLVLPADDSQLAVIRAAGAGESFVVQGPPGTGKSQTIANLIADAVGHGRTVLFVCTKRAALDVVHARLREVGLADLTCLIHDARLDRRAFVHGLRDSYHAWKESPEDAVELRERVRRTTQHLAAAEAVLDGYAELIDRPPAPGGPTLRWVLTRLVEGPSESVLAGEELPSLADWYPAREALHRLGTLVGPGRFPPARFMPRHVLEDLYSDRPGIDGSTDPGAKSRSWATLVLDNLRHWEWCRTNLAETSDRARDWNSTLPLDDPRREQFFLAAQKSPLGRLFSPDWWAARRLVRAGYRGPLGPAKALELLHEQGQALQMLRTTREHLQSLLSGEGEPGPEVSRAMYQLQEGAPPSPELVQALIDLQQYPALMPWLHSGRFSAGATESEILKRVVAARRSDLDAFSTDDLLTQASILDESRPQAARLTARMVKANARNAFRDRDAWSRRHNLGQAEERQRAQWAEGRKILLREFRKVRVYKPIRELAGGPTGKLVEKLRPVWLMSPEAAADTLPLTAGLFDLVIVDEASQMPVEEAVPAIHRGAQLIVVGDRMQLPPTRFFETGASTESLLALASARLPTRMLTWHYRSRSEDLMAFGNAHFYDGRLRMAPQPRNLTVRRPPIVIEIGDPREPMVPSEQVKAGVDGLLERSVSLHSTPGAHYRQQANRGEARYVAELVRELLRRSTGLTIGVVAFSLAQRAAVERALDELEATDPEFAALYAAEQDRKDSEQAVGLFVKNLENVQGDERDVMIISVGYGPDQNGRMLSAFGPLSTEGGERRLNVVTSRARSHLAVVTSIPANGIPVGDNRGTESLRQYLAYAAAVSEGDADRAREHLSGKVSDEVATPVASVASGGTSRPPGGWGTIVENWIARELRARGLDVTDGFAAGMFRIDLAVSSPERQGVWVAVLIEDAGGRTALEPLTSASLLGRAGWTVVPVLLRDWYLAPDDILLRITAWFSRPA